MTRHDSKQWVIRSGSGVDAHVPRTATDGGGSFEECVVEIRGDVNSFLIGSRRGGDKTCTWRDLETERGRSRCAPGV